MESAMTVLLGTSAALLGVSALIVVGRMTRGPTMLDRAIAFDVLVAIAICSVALDAAVRRDGENLPLLLVATLLGFVGSVSIARFSPGSDNVEVEDPDREDPDDDTDDDTDVDPDGQTGGAADGVHQTSEPTRGDLR